MEEGTSDTQFRFKDGPKLWEDRHCGINALFQRFLDMNQDLFTCCVDLEDAFDRFKYDNLQKLLFSKNSHSKDIRINNNILETKREY